MSVCLEAQIWDAIETRRDSFHRELADLTPATIRAIGAPSDGRAGTGPSATSRGVRLGQAAADNTCCSLAVAISSSMRSIAATSRAKRSRAARYICRSL